MTERAVYSRRAALVLGGATLGAAACSGPSGKAASFKVGSTATGAPFSFLDVKTNTLVGAMVDIAQAVAKEAGLAIAVEVTAFSALIPSLTAHKIDMVAAGILRTPERKQVVAFTKPVFAYGANVVLKSDDQRAMKTVADLKPLTVGAQVGTRFVQQLTDAGVSSVKTYDSLADALRDLQAGRLQAVYGDAPLLAYRFQISPPPLRLAQDFTPPAKESVCLVVRKDETQLLEKLNAAIDRLKNAQIAQILAKWNLA